MFNDKMITVRDKVGTIQRYMKEITTVQMNQVLAKSFQVQDLMQELLQYKLGILF